MVGLLIQGRRGCLVAQLKFGVHTHVQCPHKGTQKLNAGFPVEWGGVGHRRCAGAIQMFQATGHFDVRFGFVAARHHQIGLYGHAQAHQKVIEGHPNDGVLGAVDDGQHGVFGGVGLDELALFRLSMDRVVKLPRCHRGNGDESHSVQGAARVTGQPDTVAA